MIVSLNAYRSAQSIGVKHISNSMKEYFYKYRYLVRPAEEYYLIWESYYHNKDFKQISFENMKKERAVQIDNFQDAFFIYREKLKQNYKMHILYVLHLK